MARGRTSSLVIRLTAAKRSAWAAVPRRTPGSAGLARRVRMVLRRAAGASLADVARWVGGAPHVGAVLMTPGPSNGHATIKIESVTIRTEPITLLKKMRAMVGPDSIQMYAVTVKGTDIATSQPIERTYLRPHTP